jgi:hypothetical protein
MTKLIQHELTTVTIYGATIVPSLANSDPIPNPALRTTVGNNSAL